MNTWPKEKLEIVECCPVCKCANKELAYEGLEDKIFYTASGKWKLWRCLECYSSYLSPRPDPSSIHLAYEEYYTHSAPSFQENYSQLSFLRKIRRTLINGYINQRFGASMNPSSRIGLIICKAFPFLKKTIDLRFRDLPLTSKDKPKVLDVGCGSGTFLLDSSLCGWDAVGIDIDQSAIKNCTNYGLTAFQGSLDLFENNQTRFNYITMDHVIEHLHDPVDSLQHCYNLLENGGKIWIQTPNNQSFGHKLFGKNWRGLEPPRHLVIFNKSSIKKALKNVGFKRVKFINSIDPSKRTFSASFAISKGISPYSDFRTPLKYDFFAFFNKLASMLFRKKSEFITVIAEK